MTGSLPKPLWDLFFWQQKLVLHKYDFCVSALLQLSELQEALKELAYKALAVMKIKRYTKEGNNDTCAVCLENFYLKQVGEKVI